MNKKSLLLVVIILCIFFFMQSELLTQEIGKEVTVNKKLSGDNWEFNLMSYTNTGKTYLSSSGTSIPTHLRNEISVKDKTNEVFWKIHIVYKTKSKANAACEFYHNQITPLIKAKALKDDTTSSWTELSNNAVEINGSAETEPDRFLLTSSSGMRSIISSRRGGFLIDKTMVKIFTGSDGSAKFDLYVYFSAPKNAETIGIKYMEKPAIVLFDKNK